jgi:hypothetical protein
MTISPYLASLYLFNTSPPPIDTVRQSLAAHSERMFFWLVLASAVTCLGVIFEAPGEIYELKRWWKLKRLGKAIGWKVPITFFGLVLVIGGIVGEGIFEFLSADTETAIRGHDEQVLGDTIKQAGTAKQSADTARGAAQTAITASGNAIGKATEANEASTKALREADTFEKDIVSAKELAASAESHLADALQRAAEAESESAKAQSELARLTAPIQSIPVINGIAEPDPSKGLRLRILLRSDVRIKLPTLPKGKSVSWTLFIVQDDKGNRQFSTFPHNVMFGNFMFYPPHSFCTMELVTDEYGTTDLTFGAASCPSNAIDPTSK